MFWINDVVKTKYSTCCAIVRLYSTPTATLVAFANTKFVDIMKKMCFIQTYRLLGKGFILRNGIGIFKFISYEILWLSILLPKFVATRPAVAFLNVTKLYFGNYINAPGIFWAYVCKMIVGVQDSYWGEGFYIHFLLLFVSLYTTVVLPIIFALKWIYSEISRYAVQKSCLLLICPP